MAMTAKAFAASYPHEDAEMFKLHCLYRKHEVVEIVDMPNYKVKYARCSCGAVFFLGNNDTKVLFPIWQKGLEDGIPPSLIKQKHIDWNLAYYALPSNQRSSMRNDHRYDTALLLALGLAEAERQL